MEKTMKVVTGYRLTPVELPTPTSVAVRDHVTHLRRTLLRARLAVRHKVEAIQPWAVRELGRPLVAADVRMSAAVCTLLITACTGALLLIVPSLAWTSAEVVSLLKREKGGAL